MDNQLKEIRKEHGLTAIYVAEKLGVTKTTFSMWENGAREFSIATLLKLAEFYDVSTDRILGIDDGKQNAKSADSEIKANVDTNTMAFDGKPVYSPKIGWVLINAVDNYAITATGKKYDISDIKEAYVCSPDYDITLPMYLHPLEITEIARYKKVWVEPILNDRNLSPMVRGWYKVDKKHVSNILGNEFHFDTYNKTWVAYPDEFMVDFDKD